MLPILMIVFYALGDGNGGFTLLQHSGNFRTGASEIIVACTVAGFTVCTVVCLLLAYPLAVILRKLEHREKRIDGYYRDSSDVGKLCTAYYGLAVVVVQKRNY